MNCKIITSCLLFISIILTRNVSAQHVTTPCGTTEEQQKLFKDHPELKEEFLKERNRLEVLDKNAAANGYKKQSRATAPVYTIPVVFHVLHRGGPENISDAQIFDEMRILNEDFRKLNSDTILIVPAFQSIADDAGIEFKLAQKDPNGNCTNGIDRIFTILAYHANDGSKINQWDPKKYLNIWTAEDPLANGSAAYAHFPGGPAATDGIMSLHNYVGSIGTSNPYNSGNLTHEIGHYLNLEHTWGPSNTAGVTCGDDGVSDTPITKGFDLVCPLTNSSVCNPPIEENVQNHMEYSYCEIMFTAGQVVRMRNCLTASISHRDSLITPSNLFATGVSTPAVLCNTDFISNSGTHFICEGDSITYTSSSYNAHPTNWSWNFPGGTPSVSTDSTPTVTYLTPGIYSTSLTVSNASDSASITKTDFIYVNSTTATYNSSIYSEGFEGSTFPNSDWVVDNQFQAGTSWVQTTAAASSGSKSVMITNAAASAGFVDQLTGPSLDITSLTGAIGISFKEAYAKRTSTSADLLRVYVSADCGKTWVLRGTYTASALATAPIQSGNFVPASNQWATKTISLASFSSATSLFFKFRFISDGGNNIYIDDINIGGTTGVDEINNELGFNISPNPMQENSVIDFSLLNKAHVTISLFDIVGRETAAIYNGELSAGKHQYSIEPNKKLAPGVYLITFSVGESHLTRKLIVN